MAIHRRLAPEHGYKASAIMRAATRRKAVMDGLAKIGAGAGNIGMIARAEPVLERGHVILEVSAAGICGTDIHIADDEFPSRPPVTMGHEVCGVVSAVGEGVGRDWHGARVVSETYFTTCGACPLCLSGRRNLCLDRRSIGSAVDGAFAPRLLVPAHGLHRVPEWLPDYAASLTEPLACVCNCLLDPDVVHAGADVLVVGPGPVGLLAAQVARSCGASVLVVGVARDAERIALARSLGLETSLGGEGLDRLFDVVIECSGAAAGMATCFEHVRRGGRYVQIGLAGKPVTIPFDEVCYRELTVTSGNASTGPSWRRAIDLIERRLVDLEALVSEVVPLLEWERAFAATREGRGVKLVLDPR